MPLSFSKIHTNHITDRAQMQQAFLRFGHTHLPCRPFGVTLTFLRPMWALSPSGGQVLATAILDRLLHFSTTINIRGQSYRLREKRRAGVFAQLAELQKEG